jgi:hypothetical protein
MRNTTKNQIPPIAWVILGDTSDGEIICVAVTATQTSSYQEWSQVIRSAVRELRGQYVFYCREVWAMPTQTELQKAELAWYQKIGLAIKEMPGRREEAHIVLESREGSVLWTAAIQGDVCAPFLEQVGVEMEGRWANVSGLLP